MVNSQGGQQKWVSLLAEIEVQGIPWTSSHQELDNFELYAKFPLPKEYRDFCQIFGSGIFGKSEISLDCPHDDLEEWIESEASIRETLMFDLSETEEHYIYLQSAYIFGYGVGDTSISWDLNTYQESDQSYDIYIYNDWDKKRYFMGRSFYEFVIHICLEKDISQGILLATKYEAPNLLQRKSFSCLEQSLNQDLI